MRRLLVSTLAAVLLTLGAGALAAPIASAHAQLVSTNPPNGAQLTAGPAEYTFTFNEALQHSYPVLVVVGPDGNEWQSGAPIFAGANFSVALRPLGPVGRYTANYKVTSADGHVVTGSRSFTLTVAGTGTPGPKAGAAKSGGDGGFPVWPVVIGVVVVAAAAGGVVVLARRRAT